MTGTLLPIGKSDYNNRGEKFEIIQYLYRDSFDSFDSAFVLLYNLSRPDLQHFEPTWIVAFCKFRVGAGDE